MAYTLLYAYRGIGIFCTARRSMFKNNPSWAIHQENPGHERINMTNWFSFICTCAVN